MQGGWDGGGWNGAGGTADGSDILFTGSSSLFSVPVTITGWHADVTLNDIEIATGISANYGLGVRTTGNIVLDNVYVHDVTNAAYSAAGLSNIDGTGNVDITT